MRENIRINEVYGVVIPILGDAKKAIEEKLHGVSDRVLMPLPEKAFEYLPCALLALKKTGKLCITTVLSTQRMMRVLLKKP